MSHEVNLKGTVEKVVRANGSNDAQITITIPTSQSIDVPLGAVSIKIQTLQVAMFEKENSGPMKLNDTKVKKGKK